MEYHYTYLLICDQHPDVKYIGVRSSKVRPELDPYLSSSSVVRAWRKQGLTFSKYVLDEWLTREFAVEEESRLHYLLGVSIRPDYLNKFKQTSTGFDVFGTKHTSASRDKMSKAGKGKSKSTEHRRKLSEANKGKHNPVFSEDARRKISEKLSGSNHPLFGKPCSESRKANISKALLGRKMSEETKLKMRGPRSKKGPLSEETRLKMSIAKQNYWKDKRENSLSR